MVSISVTSSNSFVCGLVFWLWVFFLSPEFSRSECVFTLAIQFQGMLLGTPFWKHQCVLLGPEPFLNTKSYSTSFYYLLSCKVINGPNFLHTN